MQIILLTKLSEGVILMSVNECIKCTVNNCKHHAQQKDYCTLEVIQVGTHESDPTQKAYFDQRILPLSEYAFSSHNSLHHFTNKRMTAFKHTGLIYASMAIPARNIRPVKMLFPLFHLTCGDKYRYHR